MLQSAVFHATNLFSLLAKQNFKCWGTFSYLFISKNKYDFKISLAKPNHTARYLKQVSKLSCSYSICVVTSFDMHMARKHCLRN